MTLSDANDAFTSKMRGGVSVSGKEQHSLMSNKKEESLTSGKCSERSISGEKEDSANPGREEAHSCDGGASTSSTEDFIGSKDDVSTSDRASKVSSLKFRTPEMGDVSLDLRQRVATTPQSALESPFLDDDEHSLAYANDSTADLAANSPRFRRKSSTFVDGIHDLHDDQGSGMAPAQLYSTESGRLFHSGRIAIVLVGPPARGKT